MFILGLGGSNHDFSACLLKDGQILYMIEDERISRKKHGEGLGIELAKGFSRKYCLNQAKIDLGQIEIIIANDILNPIMYRRLDREVKLINHHLAHAASTYYPSEYEEAAILVVDAVGSKKCIDHIFQYESVSYGIGEGRHIELLQSIRGKNLDHTDYIENSIGIFYSVITEIIGFGQHQEGKTMGLAPYGTDRYLNMLKQHVKLIDEGKIVISKESIEELFSYREIIEKAADRDQEFQIKADLAYAAQTIMEQATLHMCRYVKALTQKNKLCLAGGVALNSVANYKLYKEGIFEEIFIQPACGDSGTSIGSALYGYYNC